MSSSLNTPLHQLGGRYADANYPVPRQMSQDDCQALLHGLLPTAAAAPARATARKAAAPQRKR